MEKNKYTWFFLKKRTRQTCSEQWLPPISVFNYPVSKFCSTTENYVDGQLCLIASVSFWCVFNEFLRWSYYPGRLWKCDKRGGGQDVPLQWIYFVPYRLGLWLSTPSESEPLPVLVRVRGGFALQAVCDLKGLTHQGKTRRQSIDTQPPFHFFQRWRPSLGPLRMLGSCCSSRRHPRAHSSNLECLLLHRLGCPVQYPWDA